MDLKKYKIFQTNQQIKYNKKKTNVISGFKALQNKIISKIKKKQQVLNKFDHQRRFMHPITADCLFEPPINRIKSLPKRKFLKSQKQNNHQQNLQFQKTYHLKLLNNQFQHQKDFRSTSNKPFLNSSLSSFFKSKSSRTKRKQINFQQSNPVKQIINNSFKSLFKIKRWKIHYSS